MSQFTEENVVCPVDLNKNIFTTAAVDNIDHNPSSATAQGSFHGTAILLFQHTTSDNEGTSRDLLVDFDSVKNERKLLSLPDEYANVLPVAAVTQDPAVPHSSLDINDCYQPEICDEIAKENR